jgi:phosphoesterase RecJ-like protein
VVTDVARARDRLQGAGCITVVSHIRPDGDAIGSLLGLGLSLQKQGRKVAMVLADGVPGRFTFLPGADQVLATLPPACDLLVAVDCSTGDRLSASFDLPDRKVDLNIDHHITNTRFGTLNLVDPQAAATAEILAGLAPELGLPIDADVAGCYLTGIVTDTIGFRTSNVTPRLLRLAAELIEHGAPLAEVYDRGLNRRTLASVRYWGHGLVKLERADGLVWATLTKDDRSQSGYHGLDDADLINLVSSLEEAEIAIVFVEQPGGKVKVSWRSRGDLDVAGVAGQFGGGGHEPAAGAMIHGSLEEILPAVLQASQALLSQPRGTRG